ncbi:MAG: SusC/RagA family TonB-linked outer membrane protein [Arcticibacter sp.]
MKRQIPDVLVLYGKRNKILFSLALLLMLSTSVLAIGSGKSLVLTGQGIPVSGKVTDESGAPLPGVSILVKGATGGASTDANGMYRLNVPSGTSVLTFSFIGYVTRELPVRNQGVINVQLQPESKSLNEVVVVGYGTQKRATLTGSVSEVKGAELVKSPQPNLSNSLAGRFSGVIATNRGGEPGYDASEIRIRGISTTGNKDVLVVVDGVPGQIGGFERLDPNDIESVTVLKDASASVYGSRAANGVILVTTKRGTAGKPSVSYSFNQGFSSPTRLPEMADAATYAAIVNEINYYNNPGGGMNQFYTEEQIARFRDGSDPTNYPNTDWIKTTLRSSAPQNQHNLSVNGGTDNTKYFMSLGTINQEGIYKEGATKYKQYNLRSNIDANITDDFKIGLSLSGRQEDRRFPTAGAGDIFRSIYRAYPTVIATYPNGYPSTGIENNNPVMMVTDAGGLIKNPRLFFNGILRASYAIPFVSGLSVDGFYALDKSQFSQRSFTTPYLVYSYNSTTDAYSSRTVGEPRAALTQMQENSTLSTANLKLNYQKTFNGHSVNSFVAYEQSERTLEHFEAGRRNFPTTLTPELSQGGTDPTDRTNSGFSWRESRVSFIGRANYNYQQKYLAEVQLRVDGSSIFPRDNRYGYFPGVSAGWRISEEGWFKERIRFVNDLKFRASYGQLGGDNVGRNQFINNYSFNNQYTLGTGVYPGLDLVKLANTAITWEKSTKTDVGLNATLFKDISLEFIYFNEKRTDILMARNASVPGLTGIVNPFDADPLVPSENIGRVDNKGVEATLGYTHRGDFTYGISGNITYAKSEVRFRDESPAVLDHQRQTGRPLDTYLLYESLGIFRTQEELNAYPHVPGAQVGDLKYRDFNNDGKITADDQIRTDFSNIPQITYGINLNAGYKNFDLSAVFSGQGRVRQYVLTEAGTVGNFYSTWADNRWSPSNTTGTYPRVPERASAAISGGLYRNDFWLFNTAFFRLKNIELGYTLPKAALDKIKMQGIRVYASAFNVFTVSKVKDFDPEGSQESGQFYPQQRIINLGVNVKF